MTAPDAPAFYVVGGDTVAAVLADEHHSVINLVERTYRAHGQGLSINPHSHFLRFPDRPEARIIALAASLGGDAAVDGIKWIASFPRNIDAGLPRASAVLILNDPDSGYPYACLESSIISAARTAASAALAADRLSAAREGRERPSSVAFIGGGLIARYIHSYLVETGWKFETTTVYDANREHADAFRAMIAAHPGTGTAVVASDADSAIRGSDMMVFATTAAQPHVTDPALFAHAPLVLHISLRDLSPEIITASANVVDDVDHCLRAQTSVHLAEQAWRNRDFITATLAEILSGKRTVPSDRTVVFSPFGLGVLDLALGHHVFEQALRSGLLHPVDGFFHELKRLG